MIGFYDYTVILTYFSLLSATTGIVVSLSGGGHPYYGCFFLLFCGFCDAFDGKVARTKQGRTRAEMDFGIQIDSLSDLVAFGVLPACIGTAMIRVSPFLTALIAGMPVHWEVVSGKFLLHAGLVLYVLAALIRLAYFNVDEAERQEMTEGSRKYYKGLPVTSAALIVPIVFCVALIPRFPVNIVAPAVLFLMGIAFLSPFTLKKPNMTGKIVLLLIGLVELVFLIVKGMR